MIHHVTRDILPSELEESSSFYAILGFERVSAPPGIEGRAVWLERDGTQVHLMFAPGSGPDSAGSRHPGHVGFVVADYERTVSRLRAAGHTVQPRREHWGAPRSYVRDPAGYLVELMAWAPGETPQPRGAGE